MKKSFGIMLILLVITMAFGLSVQADDEVASEVIVFLENVPQDAIYDVLGTLDSVDFDDISPAGSMMFDIEAVDSSLYRYADGDNMALCIRDESIVSFVDVNPQGQTSLYVTWGDEVPDQIALIVVSGDKETKASEYIALSSGRTEHFLYDYNTNEFRLLEGVTLSDIEASTASMSGVIVTGAIFVGITLLMQFLIDLIKKRKITLKRILVRVGINTCVFVVLTLIFFFV